jgi:ABC-type methionine transport system permease subunit
LHEDEVQKRHTRLEANRKAAKESRRRKKVLVEELHRSVVYFTQTNVQLRQEKEKLESILLITRSKLLSLQASVASAAAVGGGGVGGGGVGGGFNNNNLTAMAAAAVAVT